MRRRSSASTSLSFACNRLRIVCRSTVNRPLLLLFPHMCVKPRKSNVSGFPSPRFFRFSAANGPNSSSRVFSGCSSKLNFRIRSLSSARNRTASDVIGKPHHYYVSVGSLTAPCLDPQVEHIVKVDIGQEWRCTATLGCSLFHSYSSPLFQH